MRRAAPVVLLVTIAIAGCSSPGERSEPSAASETRSGSPRVPRREQERGLERCGEVLMRVEGPETAPSFARLTRECSGMFSRARCRDALAQDEFSRDRIAEACRADYCADLSPAPTFCTIEMPTDAEFLEHYARFARRVLSRDLQRIMDDEGAEEIAELFADLIEGHARREAR